MLLAKHPPYLPSIAQTLQTNKTYINFIIFVFEIIIIIIFLYNRDQDKINQSAGGGGVFEKASKPAFQVIPENQEAREGQTVRFDCLVTGRPYPEISWYKNEIEIRSDDYHKVRCFH